MEKVVNLLNQLFVDEIEEDDIPQGSSNYFWDLKEEIPEKEIRIILEDLISEFLKNIPLKNIVVYSLWNADEDDIALGILEKTQQSSNSYSFYLKGLISDWEGERESAIKALEISLILDKDNVKSSILLAQLVNDPVYKSTILHRLKDSSNMDVEDMVNLVSLTDDLMAQVKLLIRIAKIEDDINLVHQTMFDVDFYENDDAHYFNLIREILDYELSNFPYLASLLLIRAELELCDKNFFQSFFFIRKALDVNPLSIDLIGFMISIAEVFEHNFKKNDELINVINNQLIYYFDNIDSYSLSELLSIVEFFNREDCYTESLDILNKINQEDHNNDFLLLRARTFVLAGFHKEALADIEQLSSLRNTKEYILLLKDFYLSKDEINKAEQVILDFLDWEGPQSSIYFDLYIFYKNDKIDLHKALKYLDLDISQRDESYDFIKFRRAELLKDLGRYDEALIEIEECLLLSDPEVSDYDKYIDFKENLINEIDKTES